jgi:hypothetical protein
MYLAYRDYEGHLKAPGAIMPKGMASVTPK